MRQSTTGANYRAAFERDIARRCDRLGIQKPITFETVYAECKRRFGGGTVNWPDIADDVLKTIAARDA